MNSLLKQIQQASLFVTKTIIALVSFPSPCMFVSPHGRVTEQDKTISLRFFYRRDFILRPVPKTSLPPKPPVSVFLYLNGKWVRNNFPFCVRCILVMLHDFIFFASKEKTEWSGNVSESAAETMMGMQRAFFHKGKQTFFMRSRPACLGFFEIFGEKSFFEKKFFSIFLCWGCVRVFPNLLPLPVLRKKCQGKSLRKN